MTLRKAFASIALLAAVGSAGAGAAVWKRASAAGEASAAGHEPAEAVAAATAVGREHVASTVVIGTVLALRSVVLRTEAAGVVRETALEPGRIAEAGEVLVRLDASVEEAELRAQEARAAMAEAVLARVEKASRGRAASELELDRARADRDVAAADAARTRAVIDRKTLRAPFRGRVGLADLHPGQYLPEGAVLTTLQGVDEAVHVDFRVAQEVAAALSPGRIVDVLSGARAAPVAARVVAVDARIDPSTRTAGVRVRVDGGGPAPGAAVRVRVPTGPPTAAAAVPASALRKGPEGDHVFVLAEADDGTLRARARRVLVSAPSGDEVLVLEGLRAGERVAASGSFKLRDGARVAVVEDPAKLAGLGR